MSSPEQLDPELARDLRAIAPRPDHAFRARMDAQLAAGFPREPRRGLQLPSLRLLVPAMGTIAAAVVAAVLLVGTGDDEGAPTMSAGSAERATSEQAAGGGGAADSAAAPQIAPAPAAPPRTAPGRRVERSARLELGAPAGRFTAVTDAVVRTTQRHDGFVASSQISRAGTGGTGTFVLRIPTDRLDAALTDLSRLASVRAIEGSTQDLTGAYDTASQRLSDARTQRRAIVAALATATGREADRLRSRLADATARVERLEREQRRLRARTTYATVDLTVVAADRGAIVPGDDDEVSSLGRADCVVVGVGSELAQRVIVNSPPAGQPLLIHASTSRRAPANVSGTPSVATIASANRRAWRAPLISNGVTPLAASAWATSARASASSRIASSSVSDPATFIASRVSCATSTRLTRSSRWDAQS